MIWFRLVNKLGHFIHARYNQKTAKSLQENETARELIQGLL
jgi:hypothetical protein